MVNKKLFIVYAIFNFDKDCSMQDIKLIIYKDILVNKNLV
jgi:hypothetical protein